jgi:hypothetical protein
VVSLEFLKYILVEDMAILGELCPKGKEIAMLEELRKQKGG